MDKLNGWNSIYEQNAVILTKVKMLLDTWNSSLRFKILLKNDFNEGKKSAYHQ